MMILQNPKALFLIIPFVLMLFFLMHATFIRFRSKKEGQLYKQSKKRIRQLMFFSRTIIIVLLIVALANLITTKQVLTKGTPSLTIFVDNSKSFELFDKTVAESVKEQISKSIPVKVRQIAQANYSAIGDALLTYMQGNDNILLITDGNNNYGRDLGDMIIFARMLNSTINALELGPIHSDAAVKIIGPAVTTVEAENVFSISVTVVGSLQPFELNLWLNDKVVLRETTTESTKLNFATKLGTGYHQMMAEIKVNDYFKENNVYYKAIKVEPKPKVLLVTKQYSPLQQIFSSIYDLNVLSEVPSNLDKYSAVVLNDLPSAEIKTDLLNDYAADGNGVVVFGGKNSFDKDNYQSAAYKYFGSLLPVQIGVGKKDEKKKVNVVLVIDKSGSTGMAFGKAGSDTVEAVEKALALGIIDDLREDDNLGVVAFDVKSYVVSGLSNLKNKKTKVKEDISRLTFGGGTQIFVGLREARRMLKDAKGSKNVILLSDGNSGAAFEDDTDEIRRLVADGVKVYSVGVGEGTNTQKMQSFATIGKGIYLEPEKIDRIRLLFGTTAEEEKTYNLEVLNNYHFITNKLSLDAALNGFNQVVPKSSANLLVATKNGNPAVTIWRFGLGRIVVFSTDDGRAWAPQLLTRDNSRLLTRAVNWAVGDLSRKKEFDISMEDTAINEPLDIWIKSETMPTFRDLVFEKSSEDTYHAEHLVKKPGFFIIYNAIAAINDDKETAEIGMNEELEELVTLSGGEMFKEQEISQIINKVKEDSKRLKTETISYSWIFITAALIVFLLEISLRRAVENKQI